MVSHKPNISCELVSGNVKQTLKTSSTSTSYLQV